MYGEQRGGYGSHGGGGFSEGVAPVQVGEEVDVKIEAVGEKGDGIARKKGFVLFVPNTKEGDEVRIKVTKVLRKVGFAEVIGQAQGPIEADQTPPQRREEAQAMPEPEPEPAPQDSETFGEELEESDEEEPAEEEAPEEPTPEEPASDDMEVPPPPAPKGEEEKKEE